MTTYILLDNELIEVVRMPRPRVFPAIHRDSMDTLLHPANGQRYDSKSAFRRVTAEHGLVEMGNDAPMARPEFKSEGVKQDIIETIAKLNQGYQEAPAEYADTLDGAPIDTRIIE